MTRFLAGVYFPTRDEQIFASSSCTGEGAVARKIRRFSRFVSVGVLPMNCKPVSPRISVADTQPARDALATLAQEGYAAVVNLREEGEADERMSPAEEGEAVRACGMTYLHVPFSLDNPATATAAVDEFRRQMSAPP